MRVTIYPERYGVFMNWDKYAEIQRTARMNAMEELWGLMDKIKEESGAPRELTD
jgi:hypothetical protein